jgi:hypothetical protein
MEMENTDRPPKFCSAVPACLPVCTATRHCSRADGVLVYNLETSSSLSLSLCLIQLHNGLHKSSANSNYNCKLYNLKTCVLVLSLSDLNKSCLSSTGAEAVSVSFFSRLAVNSAQVPRSKHLRSVRHVGICRLSRHAAYRCHATEIEFCFTWIRTAPRSLSRVAERITPDAGA